MTHFIQKKPFIAFTLLLITMFSFYQVSSEIYFNPKPVSSYFQRDNESRIWLNYSLSYDYIKENEKFKENIPIHLSVQGTDFLYENGTIAYFLPDSNLTEATLLSQLNLIFNENQLDFFQDHQPNENFTTHFSYRRETEQMPIEPNFQENATYTVFWLNSTRDFRKTIQTGQNVKYFNVNDPINLVVSEQQPLLTQNSWSDKPIDKYRPVDLIRAYYLTFKYQEKLQLQLYYDQKFAILLRASLFYDNSSVGYNEHLELNIKLQKTSLSLDFEENNLYWTRMKQYLGFGGISLIVIGGLMTYLIYRKKQQQPKNRKKSILDRI